MTIIVETTETSCLKAGPIAEEAQAFVEVADSLGTAASAAVLRSWCVTFLFEATEQIFALGVEPVGGVRRMLNIRIPANRVWIM
jgi:hypothetical protein